jgi:hypothetical protein
MATAPWARRSADVTKKDFYGASVLGKRVLSVGRDDMDPSTMWAKKAAFAPAGPDALDFVISPEQQQMLERSNESAASGRSATVVVTPAAATLIIDRGDVTALAAAQKELLQKITDARTHIKTQREAVENKTNAILSKLKDGILDAVQQRDQVSFFDVLEKCVASAIRIAHADDVSTKEVHSFKGFKELVQVMKPFSEAAVRSNIAYIDFLNQRRQHIGSSSSSLTPPPSLSSASSLSPPPPSHGEDLQNLQNEVNRLHELLRKKEDDMKHDTNLLQSEKVRELESQIQQLGQKLHNAEVAASLSSEASAARVATAPDAQKELSHDVKLSFGKIRETLDALKNMHTDLVSVDISIDHSSGPDNGSHSDPGSSSGSGSGSGSGSVDGHSSHSDSRSDAKDGIGSQSDSSSDPGSPTPVVQSLSGDNDQTMEAEPQLQLNKSVEEHVPEQELVIVDHLHTGARIEDEPATMDTGGDGKPSQTVVLAAVPPSDSANMPVIQSDEPMPFADDTFRTPAKQTTTGPAQYMLQTMATFTNQEDQDAKSIQIISPWLQSPQSFVKDATENVLDAFTEYVAKGKNNLENLSNEDKKRIFEEFAHFRLQMDTKFAVHELDPNDTSKYTLQVLQTKALKFMEENLSGKRGHHDNERKQMWNLTNPKGTTTPDFTAGQEHDSPAPEILEARKIPVQHFFVNLTNHFYTSRLWLEPISIIVNEFIAHPVLDTPKLYKMGLLCYDSMLMMRAQMLCDAKQEKVDGVSEVLQSLRQKAAARIMLETDKWITKYSTNMQQLSGSAFTRIDELIVPCIVESMLLVIFAAFIFNHILCPLKTSKTFVANVEPRSTQKAVNEICSTLTARWDTERMDHMNIRENTTGTLEKFVALGASKIRYDIANNEKIEDSHINQWLQGVSIFTELPATTEKTLPQSVEAICSRVAFIGFLIHPEFTSAHYSIATMSWMETVAPTVNLMQQMCYKALRPGKLYVPIISYNSILPVRRHTTKKRTQFERVARPMSIEYNDVHVGKKSSAGGSDDTYLVPTISQMAALPQILGNTPNGRAYFNILPSTGNVFFCCFDVDETQFQREKPQRDKPQRDKFWSEPEKVQSTTSTTYLPYKVGKILNELEYNDEQNPREIPLHAVFAFKVSGDAFAKDIHGKFVTDLLTFLNIPTSEIQDEKLYLPDLETTNVIYLPDQDPNKSVFPFANSFDRDMRYTFIFESSTGARLVITTEAALRYISNANENVTSASLGQIRGREEKLRIFVKELHFHALKQLFTENTTNNWGEYIHAYATGMNAYQKALPTYTRSMDLLARTNLKFPEVDVTTNGDIQTNAKALTHALVRQLCIQQIAFQEHNTNDKFTIPNVLGMQLDSQRVSKAGRKFVYVMLVDVPLLQLAESGFTGEMYDPLARMPLVGSEFLDPYQSFAGGADATNPWTIHTWPVMQNFRGTINQGMRDTFINKGKTFLKGKHGAPDLFYDLIYDLLTHIDADNANEEIEAKEEEDIIKEEERSAWFKSTTNKLYFALKKCFIHDHTKPSTVESDFSPLILLPALMMYCVDELRTNCSKSALETGTYEKAVVLPEKVETDLQIWSPMTMAYMVCRLVNLFNACLLQSDLSQQFYAHENHPTWNELGRLGDMLAAMNVIMSRTRVVSLESKQIVHLAFMDGVLTKLASSIPYIVSSITNPVNFRGKLATENMDAMSVPMSQAGLAIHECQQMFFQQLFTLQAEPMLASSNQFLFNARIDKAVDNARMIDTTIAQIQNVQDENKRRESYRKLLIPWRDSKHGPKFLKEAMNADAIAKKSEGAEGRYMLAFLTSVAEWFGWNARRERVYEYIGTDTGMTSAYFKPVPQGKRSTGVIVSANEEAMHELRLRSSLIRRVNRALHSPVQLVSPVPFPDLQTPAPDPMQE